jgi:hypothetical protein
VYDEVNRLPALAAFAVAAALTAPGPTGATLIVGRNPTNPTLQVDSSGRALISFGQLTYGGKPVYGFGSTSVGNPTDAYGRNLYLDTFQGPSLGDWDPKDPAKTATLASVRAVKKTLDLSQAECHD